jgi:hypothetical protein
MTTSTATAATSRKAGLALILLRLSLSRRGGDPGNQKP